MPSSKLLSAGCSMLGCNPGNTGLSGLFLPIHSPQSHFSLFPSREASCLNLSANQLTSSGCVSNSGFVTCHYSFHCPNPDSASGIIGFSGDGEQMWSYSGDGSSQCFNDSSPLRDYGISLSIPAMDIYGDTLIFDTQDVTLLQLGQVSWIKSIDPISVCGDSLSGVSVSNSSRTMMSISTTAEVFGYYADGVPVASVVLYANATTSSTTSTSPFSNFEYIPPSTGKSIPISSQVSNGLRFVYVVRYYTCNTTGEYRPLLTPSSTLRLAAVDLHDDSIPRLQLPFQMDIPLDPVLQECIPVSNGRFSGIETITTAGPMLLSNGLSILFALSCMKGDIDSKNNTAFLYAASIDGKKGDFPKILWKTSLSVSSLSSSSSSSSSSLPFLPFPIVRSLVQDAMDDDIVWIVTTKSSLLAAINQSTGFIQTTLDLNVLLQNTSSTQCSLAGIVSLSPSTIVEFNGQPLASSLSTSNEGTVLVVPIISLSIDKEILHWILAISLNASYSQSNILWCILTPSSNTTNSPGLHPVTGQMAPVINKDGNVTLVFTTLDGAFGIV
jgi:hypothetical protein